MLSGNKRSEERDEMIEGSSKKMKSQFPIEDLLSKLFDDYATNDDPEVAAFIDKVKKIATLIAEAATTNHYDDNRKIEDIILKFSTSHLRTYRVFLPDAHNPAYSSASLKDVLIYQLEARTHESLSRMSHLITYLEKYKNHNPLAAFFAEAKRSASANVDELIINLLMLVDETYRKNSPIPPEHFVDYLTIENFLTNKSLVESYLDELEKVLQQHAAAKHLSALQMREDGRLMLPAALPGQFNRYKILSDVICEWSKQHGFVAQAKIINLLSHQSFLGLLSSLTLLKDNAVAAG